MVAERENEMGERVRVGDGRASREGERATVGPMGEREEREEGGERDLSKERAVETLKSAVNRKQGRAALLGLAFAN